MIVDIDSYAEGAILLDGFDDAIVGITEEFSHKRRILYSKHKIIQTLCQRDLMTQSEAEEYYDYNILGLYVSEQNPIFLDLEVDPFKLDGTQNYKFKLKNER